MDIDLRDIPLLETQVMWREACAAHDGTVLSLGPNRISNPKRKYDVRWCPSVSGTRLVYGFWVGEIHIGLPVYNAIYQWGSDARALFTVDLQSGKRLAAILPVYHARAFAISPDGRTLATANGRYDEDGHEFTMPMGYDYCRVQLWEVDSGALLHTTELGNRLPSALRFESPERLLVWCDDKEGRLESVQQLRVSDPTHLVPLEIPTEERPEPLRSDASVTSSRGELLSIKGDGVDENRVLEIEDGISKRRTILERVSRGFTGLAFNRTGDRLVHGDECGATLRDSQDLSVIEELDGEPLGFAYDGSPLTSKIIDDEELFRWASGELRFPRSRRAFAEKGEHLAHELDGVVSIYDLRSGEVLWKREVVGLSSISPDGESFIASPHRLPNIANHLYRRSGKGEYDIKDAWQTRFVYSPDGSMLAGCAYHENLLRLWRTDDGRKIFSARSRAQRKRSFNTNGPWYFAFSADGTRLAAFWLHEGYVIVLYELPEGKPIGRLDSTLAVGEIALSPNGKQLALAFQGGGLAVHRLR